MLVAFALIIIAVALCCALLFHLSIYTLPLCGAFLAGSVTYRSGCGMVAALAAGVLAATAVLVLARLALATIKSDRGRAAIGFAFAAPAAIAGYRAVHGIAAATMPSSDWQAALSLVGGIVVAATSWSRWSHDSP